MPIAGDGVTQEPRMSVAEGLRQYVNGAQRGLWKSPGLAVAALVTLALGIGATSAIFSVVKAALLTRLPYDAPEWRRRGASGERRHARSFSSPSGGWPRCRTAESCMP
jgi:hypothetical protein